VTWPPRTEETLPGEGQRELRYPDRAEPLPNLRDLPEQDAGSTAIAEPLSRTLRIA